MASDWNTLGKTALALAIGAASGALAYWVGMPLPWMLGPMIGNTAAAVLRLPIRSPTLLRPIVIPVIGVMLGSALKPELVSQAGQWLLTLAIMPLFLFVAGLASILFYRKVAGFDPVTAFYAAMPGGVNEMIIMGGEAGGDDRRIALAHGSRVLIVVLFIGLFFGFVLDIQRGGIGQPMTGMDELGLRDLAWLSAAAVAGALLGRLLRLPAGLLLGPMILSGIAHLSGVVGLPPPTLAVIAAQIVLGTIVGCRFVGVPIGEIARNLGYGSVSSALMIAAAFGAAILVSALQGPELARAFLAFSPGGLTEMSLLSLAMGQEPAYVSVSHLARIFLVIVAAPVAARWLDVAPREPKR